MIAKKIVDTIGTGTYKNIYGEIVKIDPKTLDPNTEVIRFWPLFHYSNIPLFRVGGIQTKCQK